MAAPAVPAAVEEPFPIFTLAHKYLLYDISVITHVRQKYNIGGVLIGSLPQAPQQNVFLGVPLELMPEEARLLVEKSVAYIVDDVKAHKQSFLEGNLGADERRAYQDTLRNQGAAAAREASKRTDERKKNALRQKLGTEDWNDIPEDMLRPSGERTKQKRKNGTAREDSLSAEAKNQEVEDDESLFHSAEHSISTDAESSRQTSITNAPIPYAITPTTSQPPLQSLPPKTDEALSLPKVPSSYPLYKYLHSESYFLTPGLRFGCHYTAYPGDPLRFHSHFLCRGMDWNEEFDLMDLVGGGRLGTGVKKSFLIGGGEQGRESETSNEPPKERVRTFCIEWAGM